MPEITPVSEEKVHEIHDLLETADLYLESGYLINPGPNNPVAIYRRILNDQPGISRVIQGLKSAQDQILAEIQASIESGDQQRTRDSILLSESYFPGDEDVAELKQQAGG